MPAIPTVASSNRDSAVLESLSEGLAIRRAHFPDRMRFHTPGLKRYRISDYQDQNPSEFVSISLTGTSCTLPSMV